MLRVFDVMSATEPAIGRCPPASNPPDQNVVGSVVQNGYRPVVRTKRQVYKETAPWWSRLFSLTTSATKAEQERRRIVAKLLDRIELHGRGPSASTSSSSAGDHVSEPDLPFTCVVCASSFTSQRQLHRHRHRACHYGCSTCNKEFASLNALQDHWDLVSHWSEDDGDEDDDLDVDDDEVGEFSELDEYLLSGDEWNGDD